FPRAIPIKFDTISVGIVEEERFGNTVVGRTCERISDVDQSFEYTSQVFSFRIQNRGVEQSGRCASCGRLAFAEPRVESDVVMIPSSRYKRRLRTVHLHQLEAEDAAVEIKRTLKVGDFQVDMADSRSRWYFVIAHGEICCKGTEHIG